MKKNICAIAFFMCAFVATETFASAVSKSKNECATKTTYTNQDIEKGVNDAVSLTYKAYKSSYDQRAAQAKEQYARSSALQIVIIENAKSFSNQIISQISVLTSNLTSQQKKHFWSYSENAIKIKLREFCAENSCNSTGGLDEHIENQIKLKIMFT